MTGVVPRAAMALFESLTGISNNRMAGSGLKAPSRFSMHNLSSLNSTSKSNPDKNWQMKATYVEVSLPPHHIFFVAPDIMQIYNEQLYDLLLPDSVPPHERPQVSIREDTKGRIILTGLRQVNINSVEDLLNALNFGSSIRQTDSTAVNAKSSRSHAVFSLNLIQKKSKSASTTPREKRFSVPLEAMSGGAESWVTVDSKLHFVDLAGSERLKNTGALGERAKEGISINAGLASLGKVIAQLSSRAAGSHVSYRDSRLTRLLQDSLGGSAITYMVACVNPAEFHLSETLNTVQYAQRARAIQSKPQIQQVSDESDKQAVIDRLRAEVSFLRDQIRLSERTERKRNAPQERAERKQEREVQLQNQLLDVQENYNALSQRHAKLISEITKAKNEDNEDPSSLKDTLGESAFDRLKRSNSFAEAVEQVVLEYEKTIQSLESSLSNTRSSLSASESTLMEKETRIAYMETVTQQLQARIHKAVDREANNESYLRDLEARVEGVTNGEEKSASLIHDLRRELSRVRESEASCEEYISTLEERLAEAEQDHETMQQEIDRLEHVIERQRSIGKLDSLLNDLDHMRQPNGQTVDCDNTENGHSRAESSSSNSTNDGAISQPARSHHETFFEADEEIEPRAPSVQPTERSMGDGVNNSPRGALHIVNVHQASTPQNEKALLNGEPSHSPAQSKFVADKLDSVTQELFDLRVEHESTLTDYEELKRKHQAALSTLAELQDSVEEARNNADIEPLSPASTRPTSFLGDAGVNGLKEDGQPSSSRTLSSELSSAGDSSENAESSDLDSVGATRSDLTMRKRLAHKPGQLNQEIVKLRRLNQDKDESMNQLTEDYTHLQEKHQDILDYVEELKAEIQKAQMASSSSSPVQQVIRRKSSQVALTVDRANRSAASLRNIALEHFEDEPDLFQNFDLNLSGLMTELHLRTERVQALEAEIAAVRKEMETKMTIISGLTRERSSLKVGAPMDMSVVSSMSDQLKESEKKIRSMQQDHLAREKDLTDQLQRLKMMLAAGGSVASGDTGISRGKITTDSPDISPTASPSKASNTRAFAQGAGTETDDQLVPRLQRKLSEWKTKHQFAMDAVKGSEDQLKATVRDLESRMKEAEAAHAKELEALQQKRKTSSDSDSDTSISSPEERIHLLEQEIDEHKNAAAASKANLKKLEESYASIQEQAKEDAEARSLTKKELETQKGLVADLEGQLAEQKATLQYHQESIKNLKASHAKEIQGLTDNASRAQAEYEQRLNSQSKELKTKISQLQRDLLQAQARHEDYSSTLHMQAESAKTELASFVNKISMAAGVAGAVGGAGAAIGAKDVASQIQKLNEERKELTEKYDKAAATLKAEKEKVKSAEERAKALENKVGELSSLNGETLKELERVRDMERKSSRLVEELEDQLNSNFDQQQAANNRYSALQGERQVHLQEALRAKVDLEKALEESKSKIAQYEVSRFSCYYRSVILRQELTFPISHNLIRSEL